MPVVKLQSSDGENFSVDVEVAKMSNTIKQMLADGKEDVDKTIPIPDVNAAILKKVIQWAIHHKDEPPTPEDDENKEYKTDDISCWDAELLKGDVGSLFELMIAAKYLDIKARLLVFILFFLKSRKLTEYRKTARTRRSTRS